MSSFSEANRIKFTPQELQSPDEGQALDDGEVIFPPAVESDQVKEQGNRERELKIVDFENTEELVSRIMSAGGTLTQDRRLLRDARYKKELIQDHPGHSRIGESVLEKPVVVPVGDFVNFKDLKRTLKLLGLRASEDTQNGIYYVLPKEGGVRQKTVRLRTELGRTFLTIKDRRDTKVLPNKEASNEQIDERLKIDDRAEEDVEVLNVDGASILLQEVGYRQSSVREKYRTTYKLGKTKVEINEGPIGKPWVEIEAEDNGGEQELQTALESLGHTWDNVKNISDSEYYQRYVGATARDLENMVFDDSDTK